MAISKGTTPKMESSTWRRLGMLRGIGAAGEDGSEAGDELVAEGIVVGEFGEGEGAVPGADIGVGDAAA